MRFSVVTFIIRCALHLLIFTAGARDCFAQADPAEVTVGERLFLETRFAQHFAANSAGDANMVLTAGDPALDETKTVTGSLPGPFAGASMNCRSCHLVDEHQKTAGGGNRTYSDFARRSPIPAREDGKSFAVRNSPTLVNASLERKGGRFFHFDGEFKSIPALVRGTYTGRNFGWLASERDNAVAHIAHIIRDDDGAGSLAADFGAIPYRVLLKGTDPSIPEELRIPRRFRVDALTASDSAVVDAIDLLVAAYVKSLKFAQDDRGEFIGSPYDRFLTLNDLPKKAAAGESDLTYSKRLLALIAAIPNPRLVRAKGNDFEFHDQKFEFGEAELQGLKTFFTARTRAGLKRSAGNCITCHPAPSFTDFSFHNTGAAQDEYDAVHGAGAFKALTIPAHKARSRDLNRFLPASFLRPNALGLFDSIPAADQPRLTDLGLWNFVNNPDLSSGGRALRKAACASELCSPELALKRSLAAFKTPGLRDLADSAPYLHTGQKDSLIDVVDFYRNSSALRRKGQLRNGDPEISFIALEQEDVTPLVKFLRALTEDYS